MTGGNGDVILTGDAEYSTVIQYYSCDLWSSGRLYKNKAITRIKNKKYYLYELMTWNLKVRNQIKLPTYFMVSYKDNEEKTHSSCRLI